MPTQLRDLHRQAFGELRYEPIQRRVRADAAVDSTRALLVWEPRRIVPGYAVPEEDIREPVTPAEPSGAEVPGLLHPGIPFAVHSTPGTPVTIGGRAGAGFRMDELPGYVALDSAAFDAWFEEDERVRGHPRDPYHRIDVRQTSRPVRVELDGEVLASTTRARLLYETNLPTRYYLPKEDVRGELVPSAARSYCPYKGEASYWAVGGHENVAWSYEEPLHDGPPVAGLVAFWDESVEIYLDDERTGVADPGAPDTRRADFGL
jgi:uncharacterized protein (DUF427 family)